MTRYGIYLDTITLGGFLTLAVIALCSYRVTRVVTEDSITDPLREWLWHRAYRQNHSVYDSARDTEVAQVTRRSMWWEKAYQLAECPFCWGVWQSAFVWWAWWFWPWGWVKPAITIGAVMGMQAFVGSRKDA